MIGTTIHNFRIIAELGKGGMGVVYLAEHTKFAKKFAIKSLSTSLSADPQFRKRFFEEGKTQALLSHSNIVQVTDFIEAGGQFFIVMEYVDGEDLSRRIQAKGRLDEAEALGIFQDMLTGIAYAHSQGVIHRDIKPSNVIVDSQGRARIMDFGIAILAGGEGRRLTDTGSAIGSPWYMSPEQIQRPKQVDRRADIYSLGIVLYEMLAGDVPFNGDTEYIVKDQQVKSPVPDLHRLVPEVSQELAQIVRRALAKNPAERFQDCAEFLDCIRAYERSHAETGTRPTVRPAALWAVAAALLISTALFFLAKPSPGPATPPVPVPGPGDGPQREIAYNLIQTASEKALMICREFEKVKIKRNTLEEVSKLDSSSIDSAQLEGLKQQIGDSEKNISSWVPSYGEYLDRLVGLKSDLVDGEFEHYAQALTQKESFGQLPATRMMKQHTVGKRQGISAPNVDSMQKECSEAAVS